MAQMATDLGLSPSQVHASLKRLERSRLVAPQTNQPHLRAVEEFLLHGVKYAFPALRGEATRGTPTAYAAPPSASRSRQVAIHHRCGRTPKARSAD
jgi:hypothetical protein